MKIEINGQNAAALAGNHGFSLISNEKLLQIHAAMLRCRLLAERLRLLAEQGALVGFLKPQLGLEAVAAGVIIDLLPGDKVFPARDNPIVNLLKGEALETFLTRTAKPRASQLNQAVRAAMKNKKTKNGKIVVAFADGEASFPAEALEAARTQKLPILFLCRKSVLSADVVLKAGKIPLLPVDGNDAVAVYRVATESITHARRGNGPTLIECIFAPSEAHDPISKMESYLTRKGLFDEELKRSAAAAFMHELDAAIQTALR